MNPHSLQSVQRQGLSPAERFKALGPIAARHGRYEKGAVLPETQIPFCPKVKVAEFPEGFIPVKWMDGLRRMHNQISPCCSKPENHEIEGRKSHPDEDVPDIYIFHCTCGKKHVRWLLGTTDDVARPVWQAA